MPTKRSHTKSRLGCRACKLRKVKCDEQRPVCVNCSKRYPHVTACDFDPLPQPPSSSRGAALITTTQAPTPTSSSATAATPPSSSSHTNHPSPLTASVSIHLPQQPRAYDARLLDLRLFHQWLTSTAATYTEYLQHDVMNGWIRQMPVWAFEHEFVLDFMLAFAALHLWWQDPDQSNTEMKSAYLYYIASAGPKHRRALSHVTRANAQPLFVAAMMTNLQAKILPLLRAPDEPYELPLQMFSLINGIVATYDAVSQYISKDDIKKIADLGPMLYPDGIDLDETGFLPQEDREDMEMLLRAVDGEVEPETGAAESSSTMVSDRRSILRSAISHLGAIQFGWAAHEPETWTLRRMNFWTQQVGPGFVKLLERRDPVAMAVLARYFLQMKDRREWFLRGTAEREVKGVASLMPGEKVWLMEFPLRRIGVEGGG